MKLFICKRDHEYWKGALLIAAVNEEFAEALFLENQGNEGRFPSEIKDTGREVSGPPGIVYDDELR